MRLAKYLAHAGVASRRAAEQLVFGGRVTLNGSLVRDPARDVGDTDEVRVDGRQVSAAGPERLVFALNKPTGFVSTAADDRGRPTVVDLIPSAERLYPVGRLDAETTGLILLTNDGDLAHRLTHPRFQVPRTYRAKVVRPPVRPAALETLRTGVDLEDGRTRPAEVRRIAADRLEIVLREGRKRQIRRMCEAVGHPVIELERIAFGPLKLGSLKQGDHRKLTQKEVEALRMATSPSGWTKPRPASSRSAAPSPSRPTKRTRSSTRPKS